MKTANFKESEMQAMIDAGTIYIFAYKSAYHLRQSPNGGFVLTKMPHRLSENYTRRGRFIAVSEKKASEILYRWKTNKPNQPQSQTYQDNEHHDYP